MVIERIQKKCPGCGCVLPIEHFSRNASRADGRQADCKDCQRATNRKYNDRNSAYWVGKRKAEVHNPQETQGTADKGDMESHNAAVDDIKI